MKPRRRYLLRLLAPTALLLWSTSAAFTEPDVLIDGLRGPDGLAVAPDSTLYVCEELAGRVLALRNDSLLTVAEGLSHPEGICCLPDGGLLVTEDVSGGRVLLLDGSGGMEVLAGGLQAPEGVCALPRGDVAVTWSNAQSSGIPFPLRTGILAIRQGSVTDLAGLELVYSLSDLACDSAGVIYAANESSGMLTWNSVLAFRNGDMEVLCQGLFACEGLGLSPGGAFPIYVAEEDRGYGGRVVSVTAAGEVRVIADSLGTVEDVAVLPDGSLAVSEDGTGRVLRIYVDAEEGAARAGLRNP